MMMMMMITSLLMVSRFASTLFSCSPWVSIIINTIILIVILLINIAIITVIIIIIITWVSNMARVFCPVSCVCQKRLKIRSS